MIQTAVVLIGGKGTRLASKFPEVIKPLTPIGGVPFLEHLLRLLEDQDFRKVILLSGFRSEQVDEFLKQRPKSKLEILNFVESSPMGTAGALKASEKELAREESFLLMNGDTFFEGNLTPLRQAPLSKSEPAFVGVVEVPDAGRYGSVKLGVDNSIQEFQEKGQTGRGWVNCGLSALHSSILEMIPVGQAFSLEAQVLPQLKNLKAMKLKGAFFDIGLPSSHASFNADVCLRKSQKDNPAVSLLLSVALSGGRILHLKSFAEKLMPGKEQTSGFAWMACSEEGLRRAGDQDLILLEDPSEELLWELNQKTGAQILVVSGRKFAPALCDYVASSLQFQNGWNDLSRCAGDLDFSTDDFTPYEGELRPGLFLDRDGVVIEHVHYISDPKDVRLKKGIVELLKEASNKNWATIIVSNQSGLGREVFNWTDYVAVTKRMNELLAQQGVVLDQILCAPYIESSNRAKGLIEPNLRKPRPGMLLRGARLAGVDLQKSIMLGDRASDLMAGALAGLKKAWLVSSPTLDAELKEWSAWSLRSRIGWSENVPVTQDFQDVLKEIK